MNREVHVRFCERFRGEIPLYLLDCFVEITIITQNFHASVGRIQLSRFCFSARNFRLIIFNYLLFNFCAKLFKFLLADSDFHASAFQIPIFKFLLASSNIHASVFVRLLSDSNFPTSVGDSNFHASVFFKFLRAVNVIFKSELPA